jgi:dTDP-4-dehydrorhamnose reductase
LRILILGGDGMLGHQLLRQWEGRHEVRVTLRRDPDAYAGFGLYRLGNSYYGVDVVRAEELVGVLADFHPQAVVNAVGIVKQQSAAKESIPSIDINALFPHRLAVLCKAVGARLIHMSTDCVFSGRKGHYLESDLSDAEDLYGKSKYLGEVHEAHCLTLRTSIIGTELTRKKSLVEWFLAQKGSVKGYRKAIFSGFTTIEMARIIESLLVRHPHASGLYHVSSAPISKLELLAKIKEKLGLPVQIVPDESLDIDRSLDSSRFRKEFGYMPPSWDGMLDELTNDIKRGGK